MEIRKVQRTGDMHYLYLPTEWCKKHRISAGSKISLEQGDDGSLSILPRMMDTETKHLTLSLSENDEEVIQKLIMACYINPLASFNISLEKDISINELIHNKRIVNLESVEIGNNLISCESPIFISDPVPLFKTMVRKIKNLLALMAQNCNSDIIDKYEEGINRNRILIDKSILSILTFTRSSKHKLIHLYYISAISKELEKIIHTIKILDKPDVGLLKAISEPINCLELMVNSPNQLNYTNAIKFIKKNKKLKQINALNKSDRCMIFKLFSNVSEILINWAITNEIDKD